MRPPPLRHEFRMEVYQAAEMHIGKLNKEQQEYPIYAFLREPFARFLSAYHEVYIRPLGQNKYFKENGIERSLTHGFLCLDDTIQTMGKFLDHIYERVFFDNHIKPQSEYIGDLRINKYYSVEALDIGVNEIRKSIGLASYVSNLPQRRQRRLGKTNNYIYNKHEVPEVNCHQIMSLYKEDFSLYFDKILSAKR